MVKIYLKHAYPKSTILNMKKAIGTNYCKKGCYNIWENIKALCTKPTTSVI